VRFVSKANQNTSLVHIFSTKKAQLSKALAVCREKLGPVAVVWVSWPKKAAKVPSVRKELR